MPRSIALVAALFFAGSALAAAQSIPVDGPTFIITASNNGLSPAQISVSVGQPVTLKLVADSGIHSLESKDLGISATSISPGKLQTVTFTPKKPGTYVVLCSVAHDGEHADMQLVVRVNR